MKSKSKTIKVSVKVYEELLKMQYPRETISEIIERLLRVYSTLFSVSETLGPGHYLKEKPKQEEEPLVIDQVKGRVSDFMKPKQEVK